MAKGQKPEDIREAVLLSERDTLIEKVTKADIDIRVLERSDPKLEVGQRVAATDSQGNAVSYTTVTAEQMLEEKRRNRAGYQARFDAVMILLKAV